MYHAAVDLSNPTKLIAAVLGEAPPCKNRPREISSIFFYRIDPVLSIYRHGDTDSELATTTPTIGFSNCLIDELELELTYDPRHRYHGENGVTNYDATKEHQ